MEDPSSLGNIMFWDEHDVHLWLIGLGLCQYESQMREHHITGDILQQLNMETLKEVGVTTVGQRIMILKAVYEVKLAQGVEIEPGHYVPPSETDGHQFHLLYGQRADEERVMDGILETPAIQNTCASKSPTLHHPTSRAVPLQKTGSDMLCHDESVLSIHPIPAPISNKEVRNHLDDPVSKLLPAALKRYNIAEDWSNYALFICHGRTERRLAHDDKPRQIFKELQEKKTNPTFVLKHVLDIDGEARAHADEGPHSSHNIRPVSPGFTYAITIHPYRTGKGAPFDVVPGDAFIVISKNQVRWILQRDPSGIGEINSTQEQVRVPPGCLLETDVPIAFASAAAATAQATSLECSYTRSEPAPSSPILPRNILSTGYPSFALMSYRKTNEEGLDLSPGDLIHVFKRYKHLSYLVKVNGDRGWVPTWLISKNPRSRINNDPSPPPHYNV